MSRSTMFRIETRFGKTWIALTSYTKYTDALHHIKENSGERYPMRIVRIVKTIVFEEKK